MLFNFYTMFSLPGSNKYDKMQNFPKIPFHKITQSADLAICLI